jgi:hypothetical protein
MKQRYKWLLAGFSFCAIFISGCSSALSPDEQVEDIKRNIIGTWKYQYSQAEIKSVDTLNEVLIFNSDQTTTRIEDDTARFPGFYKILYGSFECYGTRSGVFLISGDSSILEKTIDSLKTDSSIYLTPSVKIDGSDHSRLIFFIQCTNPLISIVYNRVK